jgi:FeS assembly protein IscX
MDQIGWTDIDEIAYRLVQAHPDTDPLGVLFTDLHRWVLELDGFTGDAQRGGEKVLEAIQTAWIEELED